MTWNPRLEPYRVRKIRSNGGRGMHGWSDSVAVYATLDEAAAEVAAPMTGGVYLVQLDQVQLDDAGRTVGWTAIANRRFRKPITWTNRTQAH